VLERVCPGNNPGNKSEGYFDAPPELHAIEQGVEKRSDQAIRSVLRVLMMNTMLSVRLDDPKPLEKSNQAAVLALRPVTPTMNLIGERPDETKEIEVPGWGSGNSKTNAKNKATGQKAHSVTSPKWTLGEETWLRMMNDIRRDDKRTNDRPSFLAVRVLNPMENAGYEIEQKKQSERLKKDPDDHSLSPIADAGFRGQAQFGRDCTSLQLLTHCVRRVPRNTPMRTVVQTRTRTSRQN